MSILQSGRYSSDHAAELSLLQLQHPQVFVIPHLSDISMEEAGSLRPGLGLDLPSPPQRERSSIKPRPELLGRHSRE
jgi:hypothetical protein